MKGSRCNGGVSSRGSFPVSFPASDICPPGGVGMRGFGVFRLVPGHRRDVQRGSCVARGRAERKWWENVTVGLVSLCSLGDVRVSQLKQGWEVMHASQQA